MFHLGWNTFNRSPSLQPHVYMLDVCELTASVLLKARGKLSRGWLISGMNTTFMERVSAKPLFLCPAKTAIKLEAREKNSGSAQMPLQVCCNELEQRYWVLK